MRPINRTAFALQESLAALWATATAERTTREAGEPGVRLRCYLDLRQQLTEHEATVTGMQSGPSAP
ncbi:DUF6207 family protein [Streptomyces sp. MN13]